MASTRESQDRELAEELRLAVSHLVRSTRAHADELPRAHAETLALLERHGGRTIAELAADRGVRHQAMSRTVAELDKAGMIERRQSPSDARAFIIRLAERGRVALQRDREARRDLLARAIAALDDDDRRRLTSVPGLLRKLTPGDSG